MYKAKLTMLGKKAEHRVWEVQSESDNVSKTVVFSYDRRIRERVCFYIDHIAGHAIIIDNGEWDLLAFDLEYSKTDVRQACDNFLDFVIKNHKVVSTREFEFDDYDHLMTRIG
jgi:hypothetical protein